MGREIRRVPANWEHPKTPKFDYRKNCDVDGFKPLYDRPYLAELNGWWAEHCLWVKGEHKDQNDGDDMSVYPHYAQWAGNPPDVEYYRPDWKPEEMTWFQVYETVSEGTPVTPPFETREELVNYLVENGDFWDQSRRAEGCSIMNCQPWPRKQAETFVHGDGWAPSLVFTPATGLVSGVEAMAALQSK